MVLSLDPETEIILFVKIVEGKIKGNGGQPSVVIQSSISVSTTSPSPTGQADVPSGGPEPEYEVETGTWGGPSSTPGDTPLSVHTFRKVTPVTERPASTTSSMGSGHPGGFSNGQIRPDALVASLGMTAAIVGPVAGFLLIIVLGLGYYTMRLHQVSNCPFSLNSI